MCVCVCGKNPVTTKCKGRYLLACPDAMNCTVRGSWATNEQTAIKSWNTAVEIAKSQN